MTSAADAKKNVENTREQLQNTLDAIEAKLDVPQQLGRITKRAEDSVRENPVPYIVGAGSAVLLAVGGVVWAAVSRRH